MITRCAPDTVRCQGVAICRPNRSARSSIRAMSSPSFGGIKPIEYQVHNLACDPKIDKADSLCLEREVARVGGSAIEKRNPVCRKQRRPAKPNGVPEI